jgi:hypothetical protein
MGSGCGTGTGVVRSRKVTAPAISAASTIRATNRASQTRERRVGLIEATVILGSVSNNGCGKDY